ncbi:MAG TPA: NAD-dependent succinate-semialdehyde dehydrogenase [Solirubrobacteraceae bacterium]|nr:NAD-dependent succinate-semialdehyde dehydrogenase [Solirubrobacteraceae bacterium]
MTLATRGIATVDPATGEPLERYGEHTADEIGRAIAAAHDAQARWREAPFDERAAVLHAAASLLRERRDDYARLITAEMGKPLGEAAAEIEKCARTCDFFADEAEGFLADRVIETGAQDSRVTYEPLGVVLAIMPWNFPFFQVVRFAAPALMAGNAGLLKHSPNTSGCALAIERLLADAGLPTGLFCALLVGDAAVGEVMPTIIEDPRVAAVTLTGSERAGTAVGAAAGRALKKSVLELGGSDPFIVLDDADVAAVAGMAARARFQNGGQSCIAAKRFIVAEPVADEFVERFAAAADEIVVGDPTDPATRMGPLARADLRDALDEQVRASVDRGARVLCGGRPLDRPGFFYAPTVLADVTPDMPVFGEETFGPVAAVVRAADEDQIVALANDTQYGLGASVWTSDVERGLRVGRRVRSGALFVNAIVASDPRVPFGGTKRSGYGRELAAEGIREFVNVRTVWVGAKPAAEAAPRAAE